jgi:hypothetical protein
MNADEKVGVVEVPCMMFREYRWRVEIVKERGDRRFEDGVLW